MWVPLLAMQVEVVAEYAFVSNGYFTEISQMRDILMFAGRDCDGCSICGCKIHLLL